MKIIADGEGTRRKIAELLIAPILLNKPDHIGTPAWLELMFHVEEREIIQYEAKAPFVMPGYLKVAPFKLEEGTKKKEREVPAGALLWVRTDKKWPEFVEVEFQPGKHRQTYWFHLTTRQFESIFPKLSFYSHWQRSRNEPL